MSARTLFIIQLVLLSCCSYAHKTHLPTQHGMCFRRLTELVTYKKYLGAPMNSLRSSAGVIKIYKNLSGPMGSWDSLGSIHPVVLRGKKYSKTRAVQGVKKISRGPLILSGLLVHSGGGKKTFTGGPRGLWDLFGSFGSFRWS